MSFRCKKGKQKVPSFKATFKKLKPHQKNLLKSIKR